MDAAATTRPFSWWKFARTLVGLLAAPAVGGALGLSVFLIPDIISGRDQYYGLGSLVWFGFAFGFLLGAIPALIVGWPLHLLLLRLRWTSIWVYSALGALLGLTALFISVPILEALDP